MCGVGSETALTGPARLTDEEGELRSFQQTQWKVQHARKDRKCWEEFAILGGVFKARRARPFTSQATLQKNPYLALFHSDFSYCSWLLVGMSVITMASLTVTQRADVKSPVCTRTVLSPECSRSHLFSMTLQGPYTIPLH